LNRLLRYTPFIESVHPGVRNRRSSYAGVLGWNGEPCGGRRASVPV